ncbi:PREDICTED: uncharacterized protein LOC106337624 [Brassica oleracea var. oleracea]|uniref:uncharacterized protein LOC106337624 n=1 Tax=Brassica oleracea var. oleracea TaxID=109376 RepID=UPI0006A6E427|nr:PREDICTED: uncharacterized protein LOC106337624 [Brassica oleracea var. oleracea]
MHSPKESHKAALKQVLRYLKGTLSYGLKFDAVTQEGLIGYSDSSYNVDPDDEFMAATEASKQAIWLKDLLGEVFGQSSERVVMRIDNKSAIALSKNPADILTKALERIKFKEMRELIGVQDVSRGDFKFEGENVGSNLK